MLKVVFTQAPKEYRKDFKINKFIGHSKKLTAEQANEIIKDVASKLADDENLHVSYSLIYDDKQADIETDIEPEDATSGLLSVHDRLAMEEGNTEDSMAMLTAVSNALNETPDDGEESPEALKGELVDEEPLEDEGDPEEDDPEDATFEDDPWGNNEETEDEDEDGSSPVDGGFNKDEISSPDSSSEAIPLGSSVSDTLNKGYDPNSFNFEALQEQNDGANNSSNTENVQSTVPIQQKNEVIGMGEYVKTDEIFKILDQFSSKKFDYSKIIQALGYKDNPTNKYERKLNATIQQNLDEQKLSNLAENYDTNIENLKQQANGLLDEAYNEVQDITVAQAVEEKTKDEIQSLETEAKNDEENYANDSDMRVKHKQVELQQQRDEELAEYKRKLEARDSQTLELFKKDEANDLEVTKKARQQKLDEDIKKVKKETEEAEISERNAILSRKKQEIRQSFNVEVNSTFERANRTFKQGIKRLRNDVLVQAKTIDRERAKDEEEERKRQAEEEQRKELKRQNDLKAQELEMKRKNAEEQRKLHQQEIEMKRKKAEAELEAKREKNREELRLRRQQFEEDRKARDKKLEEEHQQTLALPQIIMEAIEKSNKTTAETQRQIYEAQAKMFAEALRGNRIEPVSSNSVKQAESSNDSDSGQDQGKDNLVPSLDGEFSTVGNDEAFEKIDEDQDEKKRKNYKKIVGGACVALLLGCVVAGYMQTHYTHHEQAIEVERTSSSKTSSKAKKQAKVESKEKSLKKKTDESNKRKDSLTKDTEDAGQNTSENAKTQKSDSTSGTGQGTSTTGSTSSKANEEKPDTENNLKNYQNAKTWEQKVDVLNAMVGQHDDRALKQVNDYDASKLSRLYEAITLNNQQSIRNIWLSMSRAEHAEMSRPAMSATALAFYNVQDWNNGWLARNGY